MGIVLNALKFGINRCRGVKYGAVKVGDKLTLVPQKRLTKFVDDSIKHGFETDVITSISPNKAREYVRRLGPLAQNSQVDIWGNNVKYFQSHGSTQLVDMAKTKPLVSVVEHVRKPVRAYLKNCINNIFS